VTVRFDFTEEQRLLAETLREFLSGEYTPERVRELWQSETGCSSELWAQLAELGLPGLLVPESSGGLELDEIDAVLLMEEAGRAALTEPLVGTALVGAPLLGDLGGALAERWLPAIAAGDARLAVGHAQSPFVADAHVADLLLLPAGDDLHALEPATAQLVREPANDPGHRLFSVAWKPSSATRVAGGAEGRALQDQALDRGALACAAQQLGAADRLIDLAVRYACERRQFGAAIGSFQAVKHLLANVKVSLEYARSLVYRAAHSVARDAHTRATDVSAAKAAAGEAALAAGRVSLQVHGAIGYTWEQDVHIWLRRAWSLDLDWGSGDWHRARVADAVIDGALPAESFGYSAPAQ
jgi:alkylation response protein AidB-like acyl-CoA dehydrogenase